MARRRSFYSCISIFRSTTRTPIPTRTTNGVIKKYASRYGFRTNETFTAVVDIVFNWFNFFPFSFCQFHSSPPHGSGLLRLGVLQTLITYLHTVPFFSFSYVRVPRFGDARNHGSMGVLLPAQCVLSIPRLNLVLPLLFPFSIRYYWFVFYFAFLLPLVS